LKKLENHNNMIKPNNFLGQNVISKDSFPAQI
jgi:hypothetical protein